MAAAQTAVAGPSTTRAAAPALQPFQCSICAKRFTRHENLKRHASIHTNSDNSTPFPCPHCSTCFSRQDLRRRHIKKKHPEAVLTRRSSSIARDEPVAADVEEDEPMPQGSGMFDYGEHGLGEQDEWAGRNGGAEDQPQWATTAAGPSNAPTTDADLARIFGFPDISTGFTPRGLTIEELSSAPIDMPSRPSGSSPIVAMSNPTALSTTSGSYQTAHALSPLALSQSLLDPANVSLGIDLFFTHIAHFVTFIHKPTFDVSTAPDVLLLAMMSVSMQFGDDVEEGKNFGRRCAAQARKLLEDIDEASSSPALNLQVVQACLLLQLCSIMMVGGSETKQGLRLHARCIEMVRLCGLTEPYPVQPDTAHDLDALWAQFARAESHKRTFFAVYQLDATWYQILSTPRHMSHLEIKHEMPCSEQMWAASSVTAWAHRKLVERSESLPKYISAVRNCLTPSPSSPSAAVDSNLDAHGSMLVIFFLLSSVREVSGWSTMTGRVCFERFEALHASLQGLEPRVCGKAGSGMDLFTEAMWHMAMMDLLLWSPAHTQGVVEYSVDAAIAAAIHFGISQPVAISVKSLKPHLQWFLTYLDTCPLPDLEPPWITIYAFKAALVAWQLVRSGMVDHVEELGIADASEMCAWIKRCFESRKAWGISRLVLNSMAELEMASS